MDKILEKSDELGRLIAGTEAARQFHEMEERVSADSTASLLLKKYNEFAEMIRIKQESGFQIESYEADEFSQITDSVSSNSLLREYVISRNKYMEMLLKINNALSL
ncbi:MAG: YlbF family regulator [Spirochaetes bacterium]|nr:YlbF family regulator [Spirochaetota bacterium]